MSQIQAVRGTKDILAPDIDLWRIVENISSNLLDLANYKEIRIPIFENSNLYTKSLGQVTDVVQKEMYNFTDRGKRELTLRPEGTAGVARAFIENKLYAHNLPQRVWYCGPMFRYERPQSGRQRQFHQLGLECIGSSDPRVDVEIIVLALDILQSLHITNLELEINSLGNHQVRKIYREVLYNYFSQYKEELDSEAKIRLETNPLRLLDSKDPKLTNLLKEAPSILNYLDQTSSENFQLVCNYLDSISINYVVNPKLVRGLDYYNNTTFEIKSKTLGAQDTICGGGRYDTLIESLGGPPIPAVGWAMGMERLLLSIPDSTFSLSKSLDCYLITIGEEAQTYSLKLVYQLRKLNLKIDFSLTKSNLSKQIKKASQLQALTCLIIGEEELKNQTILCKWLESREQEVINMSEISIIADKIKVYKENVSLNI
uniref:histidine-tRNA synthetase n=1 Tax=Stylonema alsidii TaxID=35155 RepID=UPI001FCD4E02|nr:histidine-tRNA synthetase [Stylonema alsidii]UNJ15256.1 histidine-tRNA synthetase [Stylonema alsidii]